MSPSLRQLISVALFAFISVNNAQIPVWSELPTVENTNAAILSPPPGCVCVDNTRPCKHFECKCICDVTVGECDSNCCCDTECTSTELNRFRALGTCVHEGPHNRTFRSCMEVSGGAGLVQVNPRGRLSVEQSYLSDNVLCIETDNSPILGEYRQDPGELSSDLLNEESVMRKFSYKQATPPREVATSQSFDVGQTIPVFLSVGGVTRTAFNGHWTSISGANGECSGFHGAGDPILFRRDSGPSTCSYVFTPSATSCAAVSAQGLLSSLRIGTTAISVATSTGLLTPVPLEIYSLRRISPSTGELSTVTLSSLATAATSYDSVTCSCADALVSVHYVVTYHPSNGTIARVGAHAIAGALVPSACAADLVLQTSVHSHVSFVASTSRLATDPQPSPGTEEGPVRAVGSTVSVPGYAPLSPLRGGALVSQSGAAPSSVGPTDKLGVAFSGAPALAASLFDSVTGIGAIAAAGLRVRGPLLPGPAAELGNVNQDLGTRVAQRNLRNSAGAGLCASLPVSLDLTHPDTAEHVPVRFMEDLSVSCALPLSLTELQSICAVPRGTQGYFGLGSVNTTTAGAFSPTTHVATFASAAANAREYWRPIEFASYPPPPTWDTPRSTCRGLVTGMNVEVLYVAAGNEKNLQRRVAAVRVSYQTDDWTFVDEVARGTGDGQNFVIKTTVTFVEYNARKVTLAALPPPVLPRVPSDLWYPFKTADDSYAAGYVISGAGSNSLALSVIVAVFVASIALFL